MPRRPMASHDHAITRSLGLSRERNRALHQRTFPPLGLVAPTHPTRWDVPATLAASWLCNTKKHSTPG